MSPFSGVGGVLCEVIDSYNVVSRVLEKKTKTKKPVAFSVDKKAGDALPFESACIPKLK